MRFMVFTHVVLVSLALLSGPISARQSLSPYATRVLGMEGTLGFQGNKVLIGPDSRGDRSAMLARCEAPLQNYFSSARVAQMREGPLVAGAADVLANATRALIASRSSPQSLDRLKQEHAAYAADLQRRIASSNPTVEVDFQVCLLAGALDLVRSGAPAGRAVASVPMPMAGVPPPAARPAESSPRGMAPLPAMRSIEGTTVKGHKRALGPQGTAALDKVMLPAPDIAPEQVMVQRRAAQSQAERSGFQKMRTRTLHNRANDATACLKVEKTGVTSEWGIEGRYRLVNSCGYPVEASWCANTAECFSGRGNLWTIRAGGDYPIFFGDPTNPDIQVGGCKAGAAKEAPLAQQPGINQSGVNEAREMPAPAPGVSLLTNHRCE